MLPKKGHNGWGKKSGILKEGRKIRVRNKRGRGKRKKEEKEGNREKEE